MVWKESHKAVGCNRCGWVYAADAKEKATAAASLQKAFQEHVCEQHPVESGGREGT
jgi:hypothetical protein